MLNILISIIIVTFILLVAMIIIKLRKPSWIPIILKNLRLFLEFMVILLAWIVWYGLHLLFILNLWFILLYLIYPIVWFKFALNGLKTRKYGYNNIIIFGGKRKGKSLLFSYLMSKDKNPLGNIDFGYNKVVSPNQYYQSIAPNDSKSMINNKIKIVPKTHEWEKRNYYFDDTNMFAPNTEDAYLKKYYSSLNLFILGQGHFYSSVSILNAQSLERIYKNLRELQLDGYMKAVNTLGFKRIIRDLPIFKKYVFVEYIYYENYQAALSGKLPYKEIALLDSMMSTVHVGAGRALEKIYNAENGLIYRCTVAIKKKHIKYDTRVYHETLFGFKA